jgi:hypothetical protein
VVTETEREQSVLGTTMLQAFGYPPELRLVAVPDGPLGLVVAPAQQQRGGAGDIAEGIPSGWLRIDRKIGASLPEELEAGDIIASVNALSLDDFDFATALRILRVARNRHLTILKRQVAYEETMEGGPEPEPEVRFRTSFLRERPVMPSMAMGTAFVGSSASASSGKSYFGTPPSHKVRGWHLVGKLLTLGYARGYAPQARVGEAAA